MAIVENAGEDLITDEDLQGTPQEILGKLAQKVSFDFETLAEDFYNVNYVNVNYFVKNSTVDCKYLLFLQDFFFRLKPKQYKNCQCCNCLKNI